MQKLSIIIPAYNEEKHIGALLDRVLNVNTERCGFSKEVVVVDDGSKDRTSDIVKTFANVKLIQQKNSGKGAAVQRGIQEASGDYVLVQDADLEYDPEDYIVMLKTLSSDHKTSAYGSRVLGTLKKHGFASLGKHPQQGFGAWIAGVLLTLWTFLLYGKWITDTLTAYKIYPADFFKKYQMKTKGFETDHEITAKLIKSGYKVVETPISYFPRSVEEGKKIKARDGFIAVLTLLRFRFTNN